MKLPRHQDLDSSVLEPKQFVWGPFFVALTMGCAGTFTLALILTSGVSLVIGQFLPLWIWGLVILVLVGIEVTVLTFKSRMVWTRYLDTMLMSLEAWLQRAGHSVDLNKDGRIGYWQVIDEPAEPQRAIPLTANGATQMLLASDVPAITTEVEATESGADLPNLKTPEPVLHKCEVLRLPNGKAIPTESVGEFVTGIVDQGLSRSYWVDKGQRLEREEYDGMIMLLDQAGLIEGRKKGFAGKLTTRNPARIRAKIGLGSLV